MSLGGCVFVVGVVLGCVDGTGLVVSSVLCCQYGRFVVFTRLRQVHYCEFCGKHGLRADVVVGHEVRCTLNPSRVCEGGGVEHLMPGGLAAWVGLVAPLDAAGLVELRRRAGGCAFCMLAAFRQSGVAIGDRFVDGVSWEFRDEAGVRSDWHDRIASLPA